MWKIQEEVPEDMDTPNGRGKSFMEAGTQDWNKKHKNGIRLKKIKRMTENLGNYHVDEFAHNFFIY